MRRIASSLAVAACLLVPAAGAHAARAWTSTDVSMPGVNASSGALAVTRAGEEVAAYGGDGGAYASVLPTGPTGSRWSQRLEQGTVRAPLVASGGGATVVAWLLGGTTIRFATRADGAGAFGAPADVLAADWLLALRMNAHGDAAILFARSDGAGLHYYVTVRSAGATAFSTPMPIGDPASSRPAFDTADLALTDDGHVIVAWEQPTANGRVIEATGRTLAGTVTFGPQAVSDVAELAARPLLAVDGAGDAIVTWLRTGGQDSNDGDVMAAIAPAGSPFGAPRAAGGSAYVLAGAPVVADAAGDAVIAWAQETPVGTNQITPGPARAVRVDLGSSAMSPATDVSGDNAWDEGVVPLLDGHGDAIVVYADSRTDELRAARRSAGAQTFDPAESLDCATGYRWPSSGVYAGGAFGVLSLRSDNGAQQLWLVQDYDAAQAGPGPCPADAQPAPAQAQSGGTTVSGSQPAPSWGAATPTSPPSLFRPDVSYDARTALWDLLGRTRWVHTEDLLAQGGAHQTFWPPEGGTVHVAWYLARSVSRGAGASPRDGTLLASGQAHSKGNELTDIHVVLSGAGMRLLKRSPSGLRIIATGTFVSATGERTVVSRLTALRSWVDLCRGVPAGVRCQPGLGRRSPGGAGTGKVSHRGWPAIDGVLWILDDAGRSGGGTPESDELLGGHGSDTLHGGRGNDVLWGDEWPNGNDSAQRDVLYGGRGDDWLYASHGTNVLSGGSGDDTIWAVYAVHAYIDAGPGDDRVVARRGRGVIDCGPGLDVVYVPKRGYRLRGCEVVRHTAPLAIVGL